MGGHPGGLPVRTTFQLWSSLAMPYVHRSAALLSHAQVERLNHKMRAAVRELAGDRIEPTAVLCDLGYPTAHTIRTIRLANLYARLQTLPEHLAPAAVHRFLMKKDFATQRGIEKEIHSMLHRLSVPHLWPRLEAPSASLAAPLDRQTRTPIITARSYWDARFKRLAWDEARKQLLRAAEQEAHTKLGRYAHLVEPDLRRARLDSCAPFLLIDGISARQQAGILLFRCQGSWLAQHNVGDDIEMDDRCDGCRTRDPTQQDQIEDLEHALWLCAKQPFASERKAWLRTMASVVEGLQLLVCQNGSTTLLHWDNLDRLGQMRLCLGVLPRCDMQLCSKAGMQVSPVQLRGKTMSAALPFLMCLRRTLREYVTAVAQAIEDGDSDQWVSLHRMWDQPDNSDDDTSGAGPSAAVPSGH